MTIARFFNAKALVGGVQVERTYALDTDGQVYLATFQAQDSTHPEYGLLKKPRVIYSLVEKVESDYVGR